jgi:hypothetical protein
MLCSEKPEEIFIGMRENSPIQDLEYLIPDPA